MPSVASHPASCGIPLGCSWVCSKGRRVSEEGCHRRRPKWGKQGILAARITGVKEGDGVGGMDNRLQPFYSSAREESGWDGSSGVGARHGRGETVAAGACECTLQQERVDKARRQPAKDVGRAAVLVVACVSREMWLRRPAATATRWRVHAMWQRCSRPTRT
jgi:hypothetical protein